MNITYTDEEVDGILDECIDLENGFRGYLLFLKPRLKDSRSKQVLDLLIRLLFQKPIENLLVYHSEDFPILEIPLDIGPSELLEQIVIYEDQHRNFYASLSAMDGYAPSHDIFMDLVTYKTGQIRDTRSILDGIELTVLG